MVNYKKIFSILSLIILLLVLGVFVLAKDLEVDYPNIGDKTPAPISTEAKLTDYIRYIFALSIRIAGFIALGVMIYGGIKWLVSGGSPGKIVDARSQILGGFLGIVILLSSYLILRTINPVLVSTTLYKEPTCGCSSCNFNQANGEITNCGTDACPNCEKCGNYCKDELDHYKSPGVYLIGADESTERVHLQQSMTSLTSLTNKVNPDKIIDLKNKVTEIRFGRNNDDTEEKYCAILHEYENYEGSARVLCENTKPAIGSDTYTGNLTGVSSITVFQLNQEVEGKLALYEAQGWQKEVYSGEFKTTDDTKTFVSFTGMPSYERNIYSLDIEGSLLVLLCGEDFYSPEDKACLAFTQSNPDLNQTSMGACDPIFPEDLPLFSVTESCAESITIYKIKPIGYPW